MHWKSLLVCIGLVITTNVTYYMLLTYMPSYLSHSLHYSENHGVLIIVAIMIGMLFVQPMMGLLSDIIGLLTGLFMKETANKPLKGATPAASDLSEAKAILREHHDSIEQKIDELARQIADGKRNATC